MGSITSTMDAVRHLETLGAPEGTTVIAARQTAGRGRSGRTWESPLSAGLYCSILLRPEIPLPQFQPFSIAAGLAICDALDSTQALGLQLKWPNDIIAHGRKLAGLLITASLTGGAVSSAVLGIGLNLSPDSARPETAIALTDIDPLAAYPFPSIARALTSRYTSLLADESDAALSGLTDRLAFLDQPITVQDGDISHSGILRGVDPTGALLIETPSGPLSIHAGDLTRGPRPT